MRKLLLAALVVVVLLAILLGAALLFVDPDDLREPLAAQLSDALERPVELGEMDLVLWPLPALRVREVRVAGEAPGAPPMAEIEEVRLRLALLPLLAGTVALGSLELDRPRLQLELDAEGQPILPGPAPVPGAEPAESDGTVLAIHSVRIKDGSLRAGPWQVEHLFLDGGLRLDGSADFDFALDVPGVAKLRDARAEIEGLGSDALVISASGRVEEGDLAGIATLLELGPGYAGRLDASFEARVRGDVIEAVSLDARARELAIELEELEFSVAGDAELSAELGGTWRVDLTDTLLALEDGMSKPRGMSLILTGPLASLPPEALEDVIVELPSNRLEVDVALGPEGVSSLELAPATLELGPLAPMLDLPLEGRVRIDGLVMDVERYWLRGSATLEGVRYALDYGPVELSGPLVAEKTHITGDALQIVVGGQTAALDLDYDVETSRLVAALSAVEQDLEGLARVVTGKGDVAGLLTMRGRFEAPLDADEIAPVLRGSGRLEVRDGIIRGFSLLGETLGKLAAVPVLVASMKGKDLSRYEEEEFESLSADFAIRGGKLYSDNFKLVYRSGTAELRGSVGLVDGALDLSGRLLLGEEVDEELGGRGRQKVIPIAGISGTVDRPRVRLDQRVLLDVATSYLASDRVREKLDEKLGPGATEAVEGLLERLLRGQQDDR